MALHFCAGTVYISENLEPTASKSVFWTQYKTDGSVKIIFSLKHTRGCVFKGATSRFAHIAKFSPDFSNSSFVIRVNFSTPSHFCFYMFNYFLFGVFLIIKLLFSAGFPSI